MCSSHPLLLQVSPPSPSRTITNWGVQWWLSIPMDPLRPRARQVNQWTWLHWSCHPLHRTSLRSPSQAPCRRRHQGRGHHSYWTTEPLPMETAPGEPRYVPQCQDHRLVSRGAPQRRCLVIHSAKNWDLVEQHPIPRPQARHVCGPQPKCLCCHWFEGIACQGGEGVVGDCFQRQTGEA